MVGEIFRTRPNWPCGLIYIGYLVDPGGRGAEAWRCPLVTSNAVVKERVELYFYSPSGLSWPVLV